MDKSSSKNINLNDHVELIARAIFGVQPHGNRGEWQWEMWKEQQIEATETAQRVIRALASVIPNPTCERCESCECGHLDKTPQWAIDAAQAEAAAASKSTSDKTE